MNTSKITCFFDLEHLAKTNVEPLEDASFSLSIHKLLPDS